MFFGGGEAPSEAPHQKGAFVRGLIYSGLIVGGLLYQGFISMGLLYLRLIVGGFCPGAFDLEPEKWYMYNVYINIII